jgi:hypothetical protein
MSAQAATTLHPQPHHHHHQQQQQLTTYNVFKITNWILLLSCWLRVLCFGDSGIQSLPGDCIQ